MAAAALALLSLAWAPSTRAESHRDEAIQAVRDIADGNSPVRAVNRIKVLHAEPMAFTLLEDAYENGSESARERIAEAVADLGGPGAAKRLQEYAGSSDPVIRNAAARGLGTAPMPDVQRFALLTRLLKDPTSGVRRRAAESLGRAHLRPAGKVLAEAAKSEGEPEVREALLVSVGQSGDPTQGRVLVALLSSASESTRLAAARGLCLLGDKAGMAYARTLLNSRTALERRQGVLLFEGAKAKTVEHLLRPMLDDQDPVVAATAARVLAQGGDQVLLVWLVSRAEQSHGDTRLAYEDQLEQLQLSDVQRAALRKRAGLK